MSNRKRARKPWLGKARTLVNGSGLAPIRGIEDVHLPEEDVVEVIKEVPATVDHPQTGEKIVVGVAIIHDDGSVAVKLNPDAPQWALDLIHGTAAEVGYSLGTMFPPGEEPDGPA